MMSSDAATGTRFLRASSVEVAPMQQETILFHPGSGKFTLLNASAAVVWNQLAAPADADTLVSAICDAFDGVTPDQARADVDVVLKEFRSLELIDVTP